MVAAASISVPDGDRDRAGGGSSISGQMAMLELVQCNIMVVVRYDYDAADPTKLSLRRGEMVLVQQKAPTGWWHGASASAEAGETLWENELTGDIIFTDHHNQYSEYTSGLNSAMLSNSLTSEYDTRSISSSGQSRLDSEVTSNSGSVLPPGWSKIDSTEGKTMFFNSLTRDMQFLPPGDFPFAKLAVPPQQLARGGDDTTSAPEIKDEISSAVETLNRVGITAGYANWLNLVENIQLQAHMVNSAVIERDKIKVFHYYNTLIVTIRSFLGAARAVDGPSE
ncbi:hypothetical protein HDU82_007663 [Entophlyctis luteolus]|nr:hypothetical protein HDU82_007663 [Entophlyctis luteolus]